MVPALFGFAVFTFKTVSVQMFLDSTKKPYLCNCTFGDKLFQKQTPTCSEHMFVYWFIQCSLTNMSKYYTIVITQFLFTM